jgi:hypothetical protein
MIYQRTDYFRNTIRLVPAFEKMGDMLFDQTAIDKYLEIERINHASCR